MGKLTTHVLDTTHGCPGRDIDVTLYRIEADRHRLVRQMSTNDDGRCNEPLLEGAELQAGVYELVFAAGAYFSALEPAPASAGTATDRPRFLDEVVIRFGVADVDEHYHVPLLISPFSYSTYRGS